MVLLQQKVAPSAVAIYEQQTLFHTDTADARAMEPISMNGRRWRKSDVWEMMPPLKPTRIVSIARVWKRPRRRFVVSEFNGILY